MKGLRFDFTVSGCQLTPIEGNQNQFIDIEQSKKTAPPFVGVNTQRKKKKKMVLTKPSKFFNQFTGIAANETLFGINK